MAEAFSNSITRTVGVCTGYSGSTIGAAEIGRAHDRQEFSGVRSRYQEPQK